MKNVISNDNMKANRYKTWADARAKVAAIKAHLASGGVVVIANYMKATQYSSKHIHWFEAHKNGAFVRSGKSLVCFDNNAVKFGRYA